MSTTQTINESSFDKIEKDIMNISKAMIETFKFKMIYSLKVKPNIIKKTAQGLKEFRIKNWDNKLSRKEAYKKYINTL